MKFSRFLIWFIIVITSLAILISWPTTPVKFNIGSFEFDRIIKGPKLDFLGLKSDLDVKLGLDLQGGTYIALKADMTNVADADKFRKIEDTRRVLENRINQFGILESNMYTSINGNDYKIIVELPGSGTDTDNKIDVLRKTAKLEFYKQRATPLDFGTQTQMTPEIYLLQNYEPTNVTGADITGAVPVIPSGQNTQVTSADQYNVQLQFNTDGANKFFEVAKQVLAQGDKNSIAIVLDGQIISNPSVNADFLQNGPVSNPVITGNFTKQEADDLSIQIRGGALPIPVELAETRIIEPTLGKDALNKSLLAGFVGIILIMLFMIYLYRKEGLVASLALIIYTLLSLSIYKLIPITLTLAGIAGFILSIGIAVDANVLIFERMSEEIRRGKSRKLALRLGFERAWTSIRDSNLSTLITCFILYSFGSSQIKGFAITLALGVLISLFTAVTVSKQFLIIVENIKRK